MFSIPFLRSVSTLTPFLLGILTLSCRTLPQDTATVSGAPASPSRAIPTREKLPIFPVDAWKSHVTGVRQEAFFAQDQLYDLVLTVPEVPMTKEKLIATISIRDKAGKVLTTSKAKVNVRGFSSYDFPKKQYSVSLLDDKGEDDKLELLGMAKAEDWVLSAPYNDKSLLRDILTYNAANKLGTRAPKTRIVSLIMELPNQETRRMGVYVLTEKNTIGKGRIDIKKKDDAGNTAFHATFDHWHEGDNVVWRGRGAEVILEYPSFDKVTPAQTDEFLTIFNDVEQRITTPSGAKWDRIFDDRLDLVSAVDFFLIQELGRNADGYRLSSGVYIPPKGKIYFGPQWDFNLAYGNATHENGIQYDGWRAKEYGVWFGTLMEHPKFCATAKTRWTDARKDGRLSNATLFGIVDSNAQIMEPITDENFKTWGGLGKYLWPNPYWLSTWERERDALKSWLALRTEWMDKAVAELDCKAKVEVDPASIPAVIPENSVPVPQETEQKYRVPERADYTDQAE